MATTGTLMSVVTLPQEAGILHRRLMEAQEDQTCRGCLWFQSHITRHFTLDLIGGTVGSWCRSSVCRSLINRVDHAQDIFVIIWMQVITSVWNQGFAASSDVENSNLQVWAFVLCFYQWLKSRNLLQMWRVTRWFQNNISYRQIPAHKINPHIVVNAEKPLSTPPLEVQLNEIYLSPMMQFTEQEWET